MLKKVKSIKFKKIWGEEIWLYSSLKGKETEFEDGSKTLQGPLIKIITTTKPLSVQVHPDDQMAREVEKMSNGKSESWYIIKAAPKSQMIMGMKNYDADFIRKNVHQPSFLDNLKTVSPKPGEFYDIPAGLVHGLGSDLVILEVQQASDITYRYYDYNRLQNGRPRELHIEKAIMAQKDLDYHLEPFDKEVLSYKNSYSIQKFSQKPLQVKQDSIVINLQDFSCYVAKSNMVVDFKEFAVVEWKDI